MSLASRVKSLFIEFGVDTKQVKAGFDDLNKKTEKATGVMDKLGKKIAGIFAAGAMIMAIKNTIEFNKEMALVSTMMSGTAEDTNKFKDEIQGLAVQYGKSTIDMAKGAYMVVSAFGEQAAKGEKLALTAKAAAAGNAETADALNLLSAVTKGYGDISDEAYKKASDLAFQTVKLGQTDFPQLAASIGKVVPVAAAMGIKQEELFAGFATLTGVTGSAAEVTTQLQGVMSSFIAPTTAMEAAIKKLEYGTIAASIQHKGFVGTLRELISTTDGSVPAVKELFKRVEALPAVFALSSGQAKVFDEKMLEMLKSAGATDEAFKKVSEGVNSAGFKLQQTKEALVVFTQKTFDAVLQNEKFGSALDGVKAVFESESFQNAIAEVTGFLAKFLSNILGTIAAISDLIGQSKNLQKQVQEQAKDFESSFNMIYTGLRKAGVGFETLNKAIDDIPSGNKIKELGNRQSELNEIIKKSNETMAKSKPLDIAYEGAKVRLAKATKELNKVTADRNFLLSQGIQEIVKNAKTYGISEKAVEKMRASLRGEIEEKVEATEVTKKHTESKVEEKKTIEELHKVTQAARLAVDDFRISENDLELSAGETKKALDREKTSIEEQKKALLEAEKAAKKHADALRMIIGGLNILSSLKGVPEDLAAGFSTLSSVVQSMASGDVIGAVTAGVQFLTTQFGKDGLSGGIELATDLLRKFGVTGEEVIKKLADQLNELAKKMSMADAMDAAKDGLQDFFDEANKMAEEAAKGTAEYYEKAFDAISPLEDFLSGGANSQEEFNSQVQITLGLFANMLKSGASITEVLSAMGDSFDKLIESQEKNKWAADDTFEALKNFRKLIKDNEDLVRSVEGFNKVLEITAGLGDMNQKQFDSYAKSATSQYDKLIKAGFSQAQALQMLGPSLKTLKDQADKFGLTIDDNTKKLIDQADKSGVFDDMADPLDNIADILTKIYELLGGATDEMGNLGDKAEITGVDIGGKLGEAAARGMDDALKKSGFENIDLAGSIPDLGTLTIDTKQMEALLAKDASKEKDMKDLVKIELGPRTQNNYWQPQTINTRDMEDAMSKNPKGFADIIRSYV